MAKDPIKVGYKFKEGEYEPVVRMEFPHHSFIYALLESTDVEEQKNFSFYFFQNVLVAKQNAEQALDFVKKGAQEAGFKIKLVDQNPRPTKEKVTAEAEE